MTRITSRIYEHLSQQEHECEQKRKERESEIERVRLKEACASRNPVQLHFGCGARVLKNWINIDVVWAPYEDYMKYYTDTFYGEEVRGGTEDFFAIDATSGPLPIANESVDLIFHEDFFEHLSQKEQFCFLAETYRILKPGAVHRINTPDLLFWLSGYEKIHGFEGVPVKIWDIGMHKSVLTKPAIAEMANIAGYSQILFQEQNVSENRSIPLEYRPDPVLPREANIYVDLIK